MFIDYSAPWDQYSMSSYYIANKTRNSYNYVFHDSNKIYV